MKKLCYISLTVFALCASVSFAGTPANSTEESHIQYQKLIVKKIETKKATKNKSGIDGSADQQENLNAVTSCQIKFDDFADGRKNKETVGTNFSKSLTPVGLDTWLKDAEADLLQGKVKSSGGKVIAVKPTLTRLYAYAENMNLHGVIAFSVDYVVDGKVIETKKYRGFGSTANAWNAEHEYYDALSYAAHSGLPKVLKDIPGICAKSKE